MTITPCGAFKWMEMAMSRTGALFEGRHSLGRSSGNTVKHELQITFIIERKFEETMTAVNMQLMADVQPMLLNCFEADLQQQGDFVRGPVFGNQLKNAPFTDGQLFQLRLADQEGADGVAAALADFGNGLGKK